jgi:2-(1,2-epoxy-1,2-dihydrophenyl)acetyl-CoA isomerase
MTTDLLETIKDGVAVLTMNRPDRLNAMSGPMLDAMLEALQRLAEDGAVGAVVLTGAGRGFCAGGDVKAMAEGTELGGTTMEEKAQALRSRMETSRLLHEMPKPTIAMVRGAAAGAGLSLALACDLRVASDNARFGTAFARVGYSGDFGGSYYLTQLVGTGQGARALLHRGAGGCRAGARPGDRQSRGARRPPRGGGPWLSRGRSRAAPGWLSAT